MTRKILLSIAFFLISVIIFAQQHTTVIGNVQTADGKPAEFVNIQLKNTVYGTVTDAAGNFRFTAPAGEYTLVVFSITTHKKELAVTIRNGADNHFPNLTIIEKLSELGEVVITGTRTEKRLSETPVFTTLIREKDVRKAGSVSTLESLQDNIPGIVVSPNAMGNNMRIKGLNSRYVLFLVDGERMVSEGAGGNVNLDQIDVSSIRRIEMVDGASSALYGSNAVGAVINIITKEPAHKFEIGAAQIFESNNTLRSRIEVASAMNKFSTRAGAFRNSSDGFGGDGGGAYAARYEDYGANLKAGYKFSDRANLNFVGRFFSHETFNLANSLNVKHPMANNFTAGLNGGITSRDSRNNLRLSVNFDKYLDYDVMEKKNNEKVKKNSASFISARALNSFSPSDKWELLGGLEYNREENFATSTLGVQPTTKNISDINLFAQAQYKLLSNFDVVGGARYTHNMQFGSAFTPKLSLMYKTGGFTFRGGLGSAFRAPSIKELYYDFDHQGMFWVYGNPDLKPEKGLYSSLSAEYTKGFFNASVSAYRNQINNKISQYSVVNTVGGTELYYKNVNSVTLQGVNVNAAYTFFTELELRGSYSFCDAKDNATGLQLSSNVKHSTTLAVTWNGRVWKSPFSLQIAGRANSPILYQQMFTDADGNLQSDKKQSKPYSIWKVVLVKPFTFYKNTVECTFKIDNIFNFQETSFVNPGRQYLLGLRYKFNSQ